MRMVRRLLKEERGATMIFVAVALTAIFAFAALAIDASLMMLAKGQLQNAADAAALAGAIELAQTGSYDAATAEAIEIAGLNTAVQVTQQPVVISAADVTFPTSSRVHVTTHRTVATGDPVSLHFLAIIDPGSNNQGDMTAEATAEIVPIEGSDCLKPWMFPDRWDDSDGDRTYDKRETFTDLDGDGQYDPGEPFQDLNRNRTWDAGENYDPSGTGYRVPDHVGEMITLKFDNGSLNNFAPKEGWYQIVRFGAVNRGGPHCPGGDCYRDWIPNCEPYLILPGDTLMLEQGAKIGPTDQGIQELVARDPDAFFNTETGTIEGSAYPQSPRLIKIAVYDPRIAIFSDGAANKLLEVQKIVVVFLETMSGQAEVQARFMRMATPGEVGGEEEDEFLFGARLIQ